MIRWDAPSRLLSVDDDPARPTERLVDLAIEVAGRVPFIEHSILDACESDLVRWYKVWPGEHYKLLTAITRLLSPKIVWEFGTFTGMGTLALAEGCTAEAQIFTVDNNPPKLDWFSTFEGEYLTKLVADFLDPVVLTHPELPAAELVFIDGPKDGVTEAKLLEALSLVDFLHDPIFVFDDIREMNMVYLWRSLARPKMDMTSFGHFTGTGIVDWNGKTAVTES